MNVHTPSLLLFIQRFHIPFIDEEQDIIQYRATATRRRPQTKQHTGSNDKGGGYKTNWNII